MDTVLIVDDDVALQKLLDASLKRFARDFTVVFASNGREAVEVLNQDKISLLVTDIKMPEMDGFALLSYMSGHFPETPCIVLTSYAIPGLQKRMAQRTFQFLKKPVKPSVLAEMIKKGLEQARQGGAFSGVSLSGLMQVISTEGKTCLLNINAAGKKLGMMFFKEGELFDARYAGVSGEKAAVELIAMDDVEVLQSNLPRKVIPRRITTGMQALILEAMRLKDEANDGLSDEDKIQLKKQKKLLEQGVHACQGLNFRKAQQPLLKLVKQDPGNAEGWLWLSRTLTSMKQIQLALGKAYKLAGKDDEVIEETEKYKSAALLNLDEVTRCPFCYAPIASKAADCHYCKLYLIVNSEILPMISTWTGETQQKILDEAIERYEQVLARELNPRVLFYAGLACLHLNNFESVLQYYEPFQLYDGFEKSAYAPMLQRIINFIASKESTDELEVVGFDEDLHTSVEDDLQGRKKILVVEDSPTTRKVIKMTLQRNDFIVVEAVDGVEALSKLNDEQPDLVLLDVMLPKLDGYGLLSVLKQKKEFKGMPVIMLTSKDSLKDRIRGKFSSASAYLTKPFKPEQLLKKVNKYL
jgi:twitching motility two-component system response regulator PilG